MKINAQGWVLRDSEGKPVIQGDAATIVTPPHRLPACSHEATLEIAGPLTPGIIQELAVHLMPKTPNDE